MEEDGKIRKLKISNKEFKSILFKNFKTKKIINYCSC